LPQKYKWIKKIPIKKTFEVDVPPVSTTMNRKIKGENPKTNPRAIPRF